MNRRRRAVEALAAGAVMVAMAVGMTAQQGRDALASLVEAERAFARLSVKLSQREAFLANFADDGVWFTPGPANTKEALRKQTPSAAAGGRTLDWDPVTGDVAASGDLGYTTGPWVSSERGGGTAPGKVIATGWFFSVWKWSSASGWKVLADFGVDARHSRTLRGQVFRRAAVRAIVPVAQSGGAVAQAAGAVAQASRLRDPKAVDGATAASDELREADAGLARRVSAAGWAEALRAAATEDVRVYRDGREPSSNREEAVRLLPGVALPLAWRPSFAQASLAGDLGLTYGAYVEGTGQTSVRGYYLHVWKRLPPAGSWQPRWPTSRSPPSRAGRSVARRRPACPCYCNRQGVWNGPAARLPRSPAP